MTRTAWVVCLALAMDTSGCGSSPASPSSPAAGGLTMTFTPQSHTFSEDAEAYRRLWADEGQRIIEELQRVAGLTFIQSHIEAVIFEGPSSSGSRDTPMYLRASYTADEKKSALVHELGHRLISQLTNRPADLDEHRLLYLFLYEVWEALWGREFADRQVVVEGQRRGLYDYEGAWRWALSLTRSERAARLADIVRANRR